MPIPLHPPRPGRSDDLYVLDHPDSPTAAPDLPTTDHAMAQFRPSFLQHTFATVARQRGLDVLHAQRPWGSIALTPLLAAVAAEHTGPMDILAMGTAVELQLHTPTIVALHPSMNDQVPDTTTADHLARRGMAQAMTCEVRWQLSVNLFRAPRPDAVASTARRGDVARGTAALFDASDMPFELSGDLNGPPPVPRGDRTTLGRGTVRMRMTLHVVDIGQAHQLWVALDTAHMEASITSADPAITEFCGNPEGAHLLTQAIATWRAANDVRITPVLMMGGDLASTQLPHTAWGPLTAHAAVTTDQRGNLLCLGVRGSGQPADGQPRSFLGNKEFAYYLTEHLFSPLLQARWRLHAPRQTLVRDVEFEAPLSEGSSATGMARARLSITLHPQLERCAIIVTDATSPDRLQLAGTQTVQLLRYWDPNGDRVEDLGELGEAQEMAMRFALRLFDRPADDPPQTLDPSVAAAIRATVLPLYLPFHGSLPLSKLSGATSAPLRAFVVRWNLHRPKPQRPAATAQADVANAILY